MSKCFKMEPITEQTKNLKYRAMERILLHLNNIKVDLTEMEVNADTEHIDQQVESIYEVLQVLDGHNFDKAIDELGE